jgi:predicted DNA-binding transcriptional regulator AlpA
MDSTDQSPGQIWQGLMAAKQITETVNISRAHWHALVKNGKAPAPALVLGSRFTRWRASDIQSWANEPAKWIAEHSEGSSA